MQGSKIKNQNFYSHEIGTWLQNIEVNKSKSNKGSSKVSKNLTAPIIHLIQDYCNETSLHGLKYITQPNRGIFHRIFWAIAFIFGVCAAVYFISDVFGQFRSNPIIFTFQASQASVDRVPYPAITICNVNNVRKSMLTECKIIIAEKNESMYTICENILYFVDQICTTTATSFSNKFNLTTGFEDLLLLELFHDLIVKGDDQVLDTGQLQARTMLHWLSQNCSDMILHCRWEDETRNCSDLFHESVTDYGSCCTFNMAPLNLLQKLENRSQVKDENVTRAWEQSDLSIDGLLLSNHDKSRSLYPNRSKRSGLSYGLSFLLNPDEDEYLCMAADSAGFQLTTHLPIETPHVSEYGTGIPPDSEVFVKIKAEITIGDRDIEFLEPLKRKCYLQGEQPLKYYVNYTYGNCIDECLTNLTQLGCNCTRYYMTRDDSHNLCRPIQLNCAEKIRKDFLKLGTRQCIKCLPTCTDISYSTEITVRPMRRDMNIWKTQNNGTAEWAKKNVSLVHIYFGEDKIFPKIRRRLYSVTDLIANTGGLLGLCLGFSALSGVELFYFLFVNLIGKRIRFYWRKRNVLDVDDEGDMTSNVSTVQQLEAQMKILNTTGDALSGTNLNQLKPSRVQLF